jgi:hypothetical protein
MSMMKVILSIQVPFLHSYDGLVGASIYRKSKTTMLVLEAMTRGAVLLFSVTG